MLPSHGRPFVGLHTRIEWAADEERRRRGYDALFDFVVDILLHQQSRRQYAALAAHACQRGEDCGRHRGIEIAIVEHDVGRLATELEDHWRQVGRGAAQHVARSGCAAGEADLVDTGVSDQRLTGRDTAGDDIQHSRWNASLERQLTETQWSQRGQLGWLEHDTVAGDEGGNNFHRDRHDAAVPRCEGGDGAVGLGDRVVEHCRADRDRGALELVDPAGEVADVFHRHVQALALLLRCAELERAQDRQFLVVLVD